MRPSKSIAFQFDGMFDIPSVRRDASALNIHADTGHLWTITDDRVRLVEFTNQGQLIREVKLTGFEDAEGLCHVDGNRFLIAEEKKMCITLVEVPPESKKVTTDGRCIQLDAKSKKNKGLEGVSYDAETDTLFAVREDKPPAVYRIQPLLGRGSKTGRGLAHLVESSEQNVPVPLSTDGFEIRTTKLSLDLEGFKDLSDTFFDPSTGWLWLLSHESQVAAAFDSQGVRVTELKLKKGQHGLHEDVEQAEGIVRDRHGTLYICSEPNQIYRFRPTGHKR